MQTPRSCSKRSLAEPPTPDQKCQRGAPPTTPQGPRQRAEDGGLEAWNAGPPSTPHGRQQRLEAQRGSLLSTPQQRPRADLQTPEQRFQLRGNMTTPPPAPKGTHQRQQDDIDEAVTLGSVPFLTVALLCGHQCSLSHPVYEAVRRGHLPALERLLGRGANPDEVCRGRRPLVLALQNCMVEGDTNYRAAALLLRCGARPSAQPGDIGSPPLHEASIRSCTAAVELLLRSGADANEVNVKGETALHVVCKESRSCVTACAAANPTTDFGASPQEPVVGLLLRAGGNPSLKDAAGLLPRAYVARNNRRLRELFLRAERWYERSGFAIARAGLLRAGGARCSKQKCEGTVTAVACLAQEDISWSIMSFL